MKTQVVALPVREAASTTLSRFAVASRISGSRCEPLTAVISSRLGVSDPALTHDC